MKQITQLQVKCLFPTKGLVQDQCPRPMITVWDHQRLSDMLEGRRFRKTSKDKVGLNSLPVLDESIRQFNKSRDMKTNTCGSYSDILRDRLRTRDNRSNLKKYSGRNRLDITNRLPNTEPTGRKSISISRLCGNLDGKKLVRLLQLIH